MSKTFDLNIMIKFIFFIYYILLQIVELLDAFPAGIDFVMVFEFMPSGLWELLKDHDKPLNDSQIKTYMKMLLEGAAYMHANSIMHRV